MTSLDLTVLEPTALPAVVDDPRGEVGATLESTVPRSLTLLDQLGLWGNLGVSLLGFTGALFVLHPGDGATTLSLGAGLVAIVLGTVLGTAVLSAVSVPSARTGVPAMVLLRGLVGGRLSYLPTVLNIVQCVGWGTFEIVTIAAAAHTVAPGVPHWLWTVVAGIATTALTVRPLGAIRVLRRYVTALMVAAVLYLLVQLLRQPLPPLGRGTWSGFMPAVDTVVAAAVSFVPLAGDYSRHARTPRSAAVGSFLGYGLTQILCYVVGLLTLVTVAADGDVYGAFIALPVGFLAFAVLALRELDQSFANVYSTAVSVQNMRPRWDRRALALVIGVGTTVTALATDLGSYQNFLVLLGSVFVPLGAVLVVDYFALGGDRWSYAPTSPARWSRVVPWAAGFVAYQLINPGYVSWWASIWTHADAAIGFVPPSWLSASISSFAVAAVLTPVCALAGPRLARRVARRGGS